MSEAATCHSPTMPAPPPKDVTGGCIFAVLSRVFTLLNKHRCGHYAARISAAGSRLAIATEARVASLELEGIILGSLRMGPSYAGEFPAEERAQQVHTIMLIDLLRTALEWVAMMAENLELETESDRAINHAEIERMAATTSRLLDCIEGTLAT